MPFLNLLGSAALGRAGGLPVDRRGCLLAYLAVEGGWVSRERVALLFWPDSDETTAKRNLRQLVLRARRLPLEPPLEGTAEALRWPVDCDVAAFRRALADGDVAAAVALYAGPLLEGFAVHDVGGFDAWLEGERDRLRTAFLDAGLRRAEGLAAAGRYDEAATLLAKLHDADPLAEDVLASYVRSLYLAGRRDAALSAYARFERELDTELGLEPLPATRALAAAVRAGEPLEVAVAPSAPAERVSLAPSRLRGRDPVRHALLAARTPVVLLRGEPGIGKSALLTETVTAPLRAKAVEGLERLPYHPLVDLARGATDLTARLGPYRDDLARLVPDVAGDVAPEPLESEVARSRVAEALARLVEAGGGVLVLDDLQWADASTLEVVVYLAERGLKVYGAYRAGEVGPELERVLAALRGAGRLTVVDVEALDEESVRTVLADLMGREEGPVAFSRRLWSHTGGNPLFLLETLRVLFESGRLRRDDSGWHTDVDEVTIDYSELTVPPAIADVIARRLEALKAPTVRVLEALSLTRADLPAAAIASVTGLTPAAVADALDEAEAAGFVQGGAFRHDLLRQSLDARVPPARRALLHGFIARELEGAADPGLVAEHWLAAGETAKAREAWVARATELRSRGLQRAAIELLEAALRRLPTGPDAAWLRLSLAHAQREANELEAAAATLAEVKAGPDLSPEQLAQLVTAEGWLAFGAGRLAEAQRLLEEAQAVAQALPSDDLRYELAMLDASLAHANRRVDDARARLEGHLVTLRRGPPSARLVQYLTSLAAVLDIAGEHEAALARHREAHALARAIGSRYYVLDTTINLVCCLGDLGRHEEAIAAAEDAMRLELDDYDGASELRVNLASSYMDVGRYEDALRQFDAVLAEEQRPYMRLITKSRAVWCHGSLGRLAEARALIDEGLRLVADVELPLAIGTLAGATLAYGDARQVAALAAATAGFDPAALSPFTRERIQAGLRLGEAARACPGAWCESLAGAPPPRVTTA